MSKTQGKHKMNLAESTAGCGGPRKTTGISGHIKRGGEGCRQNETKKNERKPKSRLLMTKTLVEVRRPAQCAYACTNKESIYMYIHICLLYSTHLYTFAHFALYVCVLHSELPFLLPQNARAALRRCPPAAATCLCLVLT